MELRKIEGVIYIHKITKGVTIRFIAKKMDMTEMN